MASNGYRVSNAQAYAKASAGVLKLNDRVITAEDAAGLRRWVDASEAQFTEEEYRRVKQSVAFAEQRTAGPSSFAPRATLSSVFYLLVPAVVLTLSASDLRARYGGDGLFSQPGIVLFIATILPLTFAFLCFAAVAVGWPKWIHVTALVLGCVSLLWAAAITPFASSWIFLLLIGWLVFMFVKGARR